MMPIATVPILLRPLKIMLTLHPSYLILLLLYLQDQVGHIGSSQIFVILHEDLQLLLSFHSLVQVLVKEVCC